MLALTRRLGERLVIGDDIVVTVVEVRGDSVRLAIEAPKTVKIYRGEIYDAIVAENKLAADSQNVKQLSNLVINGDLVAKNQNTPRKNR